MRFTWRKKKERLNIRKLGLDFLLAQLVFADPLADTLWDGGVGGEEWWRTVGAAMAGG